MISKYAALLFVVASCVVALFQIALALGAPWGEFTLGGRWRGALPATARLIPLLSVALLGCFCCVVLARAGLQVPVSWEPPSWAVWIVVAYCVLGLIANAASPSRRERQVWLPVVAAMLGASIIVAVF